MSIVLAAVGMLVSVCGLVLVGCGIAINDSAAGQTLIIAGATVLVGGPILVGLASAVTRLTEIAKALSGEPAVKPARLFPCCSPRYG
jgi:hypothetical protein